MNTKNRVLYYYYSLHTSSHKFHFIMSGPGSRGDALGFDVDLPGSKQYSKGGSRPGSRGDALGFDVDLPGSKQSSKGGSRPGSRGDALGARPGSRGQDSSSRPGSKGGNAQEPISLKAFLDSRPASPQTMEKQAALTKEFLQSLDDEFDRQRPLFSYEPSVGGSSARSASDNDDISMSLSSNDSLNYGPPPSWHDVLKNSKISMPTIPSWDVVPKASSVERKIHQKKLRDEKRRIRKIEEGSSILDSTKGHPEHGSPKHRSRRALVEDKLQEVFNRTWTFRQGLVNKAARSVHDGAFSADDDIEKWKNHQMQARSSYRTEPKQMTSRGKSTRGMNIQFGVSSRYPTENKRMKKMSMGKSGGRTGKLLQKSEHLPELSVGPKIGFGVGKGSKYQQEKPRSPGPIYDPDKNVLPGTYRIDSAGRTLSGSIYEYGFNNASPGPNVNIDNDFKTLDRYMSDTASIFGREPSLSNTVSIKTATVSSFFQLDM